MPAAPETPTPVAPFASLSPYRKARRLLGETLRLTLHSALRLTALDFDRAYGVQTGDGLGLRRVTTPGKDGLGRGRYEPVTGSHFAFVLGLVPPPLDGWSFLDVGSGKGRAVLMALGYPFRQVRGVELDPALHATALENLRRFRGPRRCEDVALTCGDGTCAPLPPGDAVVFFFNSFGDALLERFLDHLEASLREAPRRLLLVYSSPRERAAVDRRPAFHVRFEGLSPEDPLWHGVRRLVLYGAGTLAPGRG